MNEKNELQAGYESSDGLGAIWGLIKGHPEAEKELLRLTEVDRAMTKLAACMEMNWGRHEQAGYQFPSCQPCIISNREECHPEDLWTSILNWGEEVD